MSMPFFTCDRVYSIVYEYQIMIYVEKYLVPLQLIYVHWEADQPSFSFSRIWFDSLYCILFENSISACACYGGELREIFISNVRTSQSRRTLTFLHIQCTEKCDTNYRRKRLLMCVFSMCFLFFFSFFFPFLKLPPIYISSKLVSV